MFQHVHQDGKVVSRNKFFTRLRQDLSAAAEITRKHSCLEQARHSQHYNHRVKRSSLAVGDQVFRPPFVVKKAGGSSLTDGKWFLMTLYQWGIILMCTGPPSRLP